MGVVGRIRNSREIVVHNGSGYEDWNYKEDWGSCWENGNPRDIVGHLGRLESRGEFGSC